MINYSHDGISGLEATIFHESLLNFHFALEHVSASELRFATSQTRPPPAANNDPRFNLLVQRSRS